MTSNQPPRSQLEWLAHDIAEFRRILDAHPSWAAPLGDARDPVKHTRFHVVADLCWQIWFHVLGVSVLLEEELFAPLMVVQRALFEAITTLDYLLRHPRSEDEAVILLAYTYLRQLEVFSDDAPFVTERRRILAEMPARLVKEAKRRMKSPPRTWSGKRLSDMAREGKIEGYAPTYGYLSAHVHSSIVGEHVSFEPAGDDLTTVKLGRPISERDVEAHANFARRALHGSFRRMWTVFDAPKIEIRSTDPYRWQGPADESVTR